MDGFRCEMAAAWSEVRWTAYFLVLFFPAALIATALAATLQRTPTPSPGLLLAFGVPLALLSIVGAGLWDGVTGHLGRYIWWPFLTGFALMLLQIYWRQLEAPSARESGRGTAGRSRRATPDRGTLRETALWLRNQGVSWREMWRLRTLLARDSTDPRVRELRLLLER